MIRRWAPYRVLRVAFAVLWVLLPYLFLMARERARIAAPAQAAWDRAHDRAANTLHALGIGLSGLFVKVCQIVGARSDVFPAPFIEKLSRFHDRVPARPLAELLPHVERELGRSLSEAFDEIDPEPIAAASLAQVHRARLSNGETVVVKIQYPEIERLARVDLASIRRVARIIALVQKKLDLRSIVDEVAKFVALELDFEREADSTERIARGFAASTEVRVPKVVRSSSRGKVLVLEFLDGVRVTDVEGMKRAGHDPAEVAARIARAYSTMIFEQGYFHGDPHPGNLLVLGDGKIGLLDFGLAKELPAGFAVDVADMITAAMTGNAERASNAARRLGFAVEQASPEGLQLLVRLLLGERIEGRTVLDVLSDNPVAKVPEDFGLIARTLILLNGLSHSLAPGERLIQREMAAALAPIAARLAAAPAPAR